MIGQKIPKELIVVPVIEGAKEVLPRIPRGDGWWEWHFPHGGFVGGHHYRFDNYVSVHVLLDTEGFWHVFSPGMIEVGRQQIGERVFVTLREAPKT